MKLRAPAKVNLHLHIHGKRPDGFHEIETLMVPISLADEVTVETSGGSLIEVSCDQADVPQGDGNLAAAAARAFARATGREFSARIHIRKNIPMGAGLAGGSSDAAAVLLALDAIFSTRLEVSDLEKIAGTLGSDVPFFIRRKAAICRGRGEIITECSFEEQFPLLLIKPGFGVETPWAYKNWATSTELPGSFYAEQKLGAVTLFNALERPVFEKFLILPVMKQWLRAQPEVLAAAMSGSGSTMFAILRDVAGGPGLEVRARQEFGPDLWTALCDCPG